MLRSTKLIFEFAQTCEPLYHLKGLYHFCIALVSNVTFIYIPCIPHITYIPYILHITYLPYIPHLPCIPHIAYTYHTYHTHVLQEYIRKSKSDLFAAASEHCSISGQCLVSASSKIVELDDSFYKVEDGIRGASSKIHVFKWVTV